MNPSAAPERPDRRIGCVGVVVVLACLDCGKTQLDFIGMIQSLGLATRHVPELQTPRGQNAGFTRRQMENPQVSGHSDGQE
jgi:hypothetical protein